MALEYRDSGGRDLSNWNPKAITSSQVTPRNPVGNLVNTGVNKVINTPAPKPSAPSQGNIGSTAYGALQQASYAPQFDPMNALADALRAQQEAREQAISAANAALDKSAGLARDRYKTSKKEIGSNYQDLKNQASVQNFRARRTQREALADRGALGSGSAMQENIRLASNFNNNMNKIGSQESLAYENLLNNLNQYLAQIDQQKANNMLNGINGYSNNLASLINASFSGYQPSQGYYNLANSLMSNSLGASPLSLVQSNNAIGSNLYDTLLRQYNM